MVTLIGIITIAVSAAIVSAIFELVMHWLGKLVMTKTHKENVKRVINTFRVVFYAFLAIVVVGLLGINLVAILAGAGFLGIILGLALQQPLGNYFASLVIIMTKIVRIGDTISINAIGSNILVTGKVKYIGFVHTELVDDDGVVKYVPNTVMLSSIIVKHEPNGKNGKD